jgi:CBS domain-containing protein
MDDVTCSRLVSVDVDMPALSVAATLSSTQISLVVVCDTYGKMVGVITKTDIVRWIGRCQGSVCSVIAGDIMTRDVISCNPNDQLLDVLSILYKHGFVHLPVVDENNKSLGVLNRMLKKAWIPPSLIDDRSKFIVRKPAFSLETGF